MVVKASADGTRIPRIGGYRAPALEPIVASDEKEQLIMPADHPSELHELFTAAINSADIDGLVALFETDGAAVHLDGSVVAGQPALRAMFRELLTMIKQIEGTTRKVFVLGDMALTSAEWCANAGTPEEMSGTSAEVARRQPDGTWRFVIDDPMFGSCRPADYSSPPKESQ